MSKSSHHKAWTPSPGSPVRKALKERRNRAADEAAQTVDGPWDCDDTTDPKEPR